MQKKIKTVLIIRSSAMGDVAMTAPVLAAMAANNPQVKMIMLTRDFYEPFFDGITNLTIHNIDLAEKHKGIDGVYRLYKE
ncbi:MAG: glycosyl transferase family 1, partial [Mucinivorans sp.]